MIKILFGREARDYDRMKREDMMYNQDLDRLQGLELGEYSFEELLMAIARSHVPYERMGHVAMFLAGRSRRGTMTVQDALLRY